MSVHRHQNRYNARHTWTSVAISKHRMTYQSFSYIPVGDEVMSLPETDHFFEKECNCRCKKRSGVHGCLFLSSLNQAEEAVTGFRTAGSNILGLWLQEETTYTVGIHLRCRKL